MASKGKSNKLQSYKILESFIQCNYLDGFSYIDKAGEIVNSYVKETKEIPKFQMGLEGLTLHDVSEKIDAIKVTSTSIWIHFVQPKNLGNVSTEATEQIDRIMKILKPTFFKRIGWRTYFAREDVSSHNPAEKLRIHDGVQSFALQNFVVAREFDDVQARLEVSPITNTTDPAKKALLFDVDLAIEIEKLAAKEQLERLRDVYKSDVFLDAVEELLK